MSPQSNSYTVTPHPRALAAQVRQYLLRQSREDQRPFLRLAKGRHPTVQDSFFVETLQLGYFLNI